MPVVPIWQVRRYQSGPHVTHGSTVSGVACPTFLGARSCRRAGAVTGSGCLVCVLAGNAVDVQQGQLGAGATPNCRSRADLVILLARPRNYLLVVRGFAPAQRDLLKRLEVSILRPRVSHPAARCQTGSFPLHICVPARFFRMCPEIVAHRDMATVLGAATLADMDMHAAAAIVWDKQTKTGGRQVRWIETTKAKPLERCGKRRLVLYLFDDDLDIKDIAGRHPRYCRRADVLHRHHVRDILRQDNGQPVEVTPPVIAIANDPMEIDTVLRTRRSGSRLVTRRHPSVLVRVHRAPPVESLEVVWCAGLGSGGRRRKLGPDQPIQDRCRALPVPGRCVPASLRSVLGESISDIVSMDGASAGLSGGSAMARRSSLFSGYAQMQREAARAQAAQVRAQAAAWRQADRAHAAYLRARAAEEKERKRLYAESRTADVAVMNDDLEAAVNALEGLLAAALKAGDLVAFSSLKKPASPPPWRHPELEQAQPAPAPETFMPAQLTGLSKVSGKANTSKP